MIKVVLKEPLLTQSGYGHHGRTVLRSLMTRQDIFDIYIQPIVWGQTSWMCEASEERQWIDDVIQRTAVYITQGGTFDMSIQVTIANEWENLAPINIGVTAGIETTQVAPEWIERGNMMDKIITISSHSQKTYRDISYQAVHNQTGEKTDFKLTTPIEYVNYPVNGVEPEKIDLDLKTKFNFLTVAQISPRKNLAQTISCFVDKFRDNPDVGLVIKTNVAKNSLIDRNTTVSNLRNLLASFGERKCKIYLLHGRLKDSEMAGLYTHPKIKAIVSTTHGEGFGLPLFEAASHGLPVIATDWSGHLDFLYMPVKQKNGTEKLKHMFGRITYTLQQIGEDAVWNGVLHKDSKWAYPEEGSIKTNLEEVYKDYGRFSKRAKQLQKWINKEFTPEKKYKEFVDFIYEDHFESHSWFDELNEDIEQHE